MIIGFWSEKAGRGSATYNMIATGMAISLKSRNKVILMQGKRDYNKIDYAFTPYNEDGLLKEDYGYYSYGGIDSLINKLQNDRLNVNEFNKELIQTRQSNLFYLPASHISGEDEFKRRFNKINEKYFDFLQNISDIILIELENGREGINEIILDRLDMLIINMPQNINAFQEVVFDERLMKNSLFVIGSYDSDSEYSIGNIRRRYELDEDKLCVVPYNVKFKDAICSGRSMEFYERHTCTDKNDCEYEFMRHVDMTSEIIIKRCLIG